MTRSVHPPTSTEIADIARDVGMHLDAETLAIYTRLIGGMSEVFARLDELPEPRLPVRHARTPGYRPQESDNPYNAWYWRCEIVGAASGVLAGKRVAIKDNIAVAGVPMMNGSRALEGYVPEFDATVVTRILDAGGIIAGKSACEDLCLSAGSHTCATGPIRNPHDPTRSAGGSSGGSAVLVATGAVDLAMAGDQGGSIRTPAAWCGVHGLKPTWGLVPATGAMPIAYTLDHLGPMAATPAGVAELLTAIAGRDPLDPRTALARADDYLGALTRGVKGLRIGLLKEGFAHPVSDDATNALVRAAVRHLQALGAQVSEVSVPMHYDAQAVWTGLVLEGATDVIFKGNGQGSNWNGWYMTSLIDAFGRGWRANPDLLSVTAKQMLLCGEYLHRNHRGRYQAKAQNLRPLVQAAYDSALAEVDVLAMPTIPFPATALPADDAALDACIDAALNMQQNTCPFDASHHPAYTMPCGKVDGLPVGLMLVGRHFDEATLIAAAQALALSYDWKSAG